MKMTKRWKDPQAWNRPDYLQGLQDGSERWAQSVCLAVGLGAALGALIVWMAL